MNLSGFSWLLVWFLKLTGGFVICRSTFFLRMCYTFSHHQVLAKGCLAYCLMFFNVFCNYFFRYILHILVFRVQMIQLSSMLLAIGLVRISGMENASIHLLKTNANHYNNILKSLQQYTHISSCHELNLDKKDNNHSSQPQEINLITIIPLNHKR